MSMRSEVPDDFIRWLSKSKKVDVNAADFVERRLYGEYVEDTFMRVSALSANRVFFRRACATMLQENSRFTSVLLDDGSVIEASAIVLATGSPSPADPACLARFTEKHYARFAWSKSALDGIPEDGAVLLVGCGLTGVDQALALRAKGFRGTVLMASRRGRLPAVQKGDCGTWSRSWAAMPFPRVSALVAEVRRQIQLAESEGIDWRAVIDSLRVDTPRIWMAWSDGERRRFLRHVRPVWETARHRLPPKTFGILMRLIHSGEVRIIAGRLLDVTESGDDARLRIKIATGTDHTVEVVVDRVVNCTGPAMSSHAQEPILLNAVRSGLAQFDHVGLGICTDDLGRLISAEGAPARSIYTIGPLRKPQLWESTAVQEIRDQAHALALRILAEIAEDSQVVCLKTC